jgi:hypothetical protein
MLFNVFQILMPCISTHKYTSLLARSIHTACYPHFYMAPSTSIGNSYCTISCQSFHLTLPDPMNSPASSARTKLVCSSSNSLSIRDRRLVESYPSHVIINSHRPGYLSAPSSHHAWWSLSHPIHTQEVVASLYHTTANSQEVSNQVTGP